MADNPPNIDEFNKITVLIFAQLFPVFPKPVDIDKLQIFRAMGTGDKLASGQSLSEMLMHTINWLIREGYITSLGLIPTERVVLTQKGLTAMNAVPSGLNQSVGTAITKAVEGGGQFGMAQFGDLIGGLFGGFTKSISGG
jgi:hypothetical protein